MDRFRCMQAFVHVAEERSITRAARTLKLSKSIVSERVRQFEELLRQPLFVRTTRRIELTEAGAEIYPLVSDLVVKMGELENRIPDATASLRGPLRVASIIDAGLLQVAPVLARFGEEHPELKLELIVGNAAVNPIDTGFDLALHYRLISNEHVTQEPIAEIECGLYCAPSYLATRQRPQHPDELSSHDCLGYSYQFGVDDWDRTKWTFQRDGEDISVNVPLVAQFNAGTALLAFLEAGRGVGVLTRTRAAEAVRNGRLVDVLSTYRIPPLTLMAAYPSAYKNTQKIKTCVEYLKQHLSPKVDALADLT